MSKTERGSFTLPGESGYEELTLQLAKCWGADMIRDSDGTVLSDELINAGYGIYSTICLIRDHNQWANAHPEQLQQTFLITEPRSATTENLKISLVEDFYKEQFRINESPESIKYWQVYDRTSNIELSRDSWNYDPLTKTVTIEDIVPFHQYTVNFLAYRIWEEIS
ncbi:1,3-beta-galactosyl-N-acetylhexosamine phosphorylase N-terminal domain-containing protein, partial [Lacrimispora sp.]|uniref:1,3-beta-galactosyl-N-acetylhexosamine phosphorylase N-terminal domain-containing protein n=1 Tax=Lacrimispora sp. TaxID=2719234 RepID=UPI0032E42168